MKLWDDDFTHQFRLLLKCFLPRSQSQRLSSGMAFYYSIMVSCHPQYSSFVLVAAFSFPLSCAFPLIFWARRRGIGSWGTFLCIFYIYTLHCLPEEKKRGMKINESKNIKLVVDPPHTTFYFLR